MPWSNEHMAICAGAKWLSVHCVICVRTWSRESTTRPSISGAHPDKGQHCEQLLNWNVTFSRWILGLRISFLVTVTIFYKFSLNSIVLSDAEVMKNVKHQYYFLRFVSINRKYRNLVSRLACKLRAQFEQLRETNQHSWCKHVRMARAINIYSVFWISNIIILDIPNNYFGYPK